MKKGSQNRISIVSAKKRRYWVTPGINPAMTDLSSSITRCPQPGVPSPGCGRQRALARRWRMPGRHAPPPPSLPGPRPALPGAWLRAGPRAGKWQVRGWKSPSGACRPGLLAPPSVPSVRHPVHGPERTDT